MRNIALAAALLFLMPVLGVPGYCAADTVEKVKQSSKAAAKEIKEGAVQTGKAAAKAGKEIREGSKKTWTEIKEGVKAAGGEFKKAYHETKTAIQKEFSKEEQDNTETQ